MKNKIAVGTALIALMQISYAGLLESEISLETIAQLTSTSTIESLSFITTATVTDPGIEFPSVSDLEIDNPPFGLRLVDVAINVGDDFIEIDFDNISESSSFTSSFQNTYVFTFDNDVALTITGASIDSNVTSLGLAANDVTFSGNQLFVNVESLPFNNTTFARINLSIEGGSNLGNGNKTQISPGHSGTWYDPNRNGEGFVLEIIEINSQPTMLVYYYTYDQGRQMYLIGTKSFVAGATNVIVPMQVTDGASFGFDFDSNQVVRMDWGTLEISFDSCDSGKVTYSSDLGFGSATIQITRLTKIMNLACP